MSSQSPVRSHFEEGMFEWARSARARLFFAKGSSCSNELAEPRCAAHVRMSSQSPGAQALGRIGSRSPGAQLIVEWERRPPVRSCFDEGSSCSNELAEPRCAAVSTRAAHVRMSSQSPGAQFMVESARRAPLRSSARGAAHHSSEWERPLRRSRSFEPARLGRGVPKKDPMCGGLARTGRERLLRSR
jgi:hypothetical protein